MWISIIDFICRFSGACTRKRSCVFLHPTDSILTLFGSLIESSSIIATYLKWNSSLSCVFIASWEEMVIATQVGGVSKIPSSFCNLVSPFKVENIFHYASAIPQLPSAASSRFYRGLIKIHHKIFCSRKWWQVSKKYEITTSSILQALLRFSLQCLKLKSQYQSKFLHYALLNLHQQVAVFNTFLVHQKLLVLVKFV